MADFLEEGVAWLSDKAREDMSRPVTYSRGGMRLEDIQATIGSTLLSLSDDLGGTKIERTDRDFLIAAEDMQYLGKLVVPERGDVITEIHDDVTYTYQVMAPSPEPVWRWSDQYRTTMRIHAKEIRQR